MSTRDEMYEGRIYPSMHGDLKIIKYHNSSDVTVEFVATGYRRSARPQHIKSGGVKDAFFPTIGGVGFLGGKVEDKRSYHVWCEMIRRCYVQKEKNGRYQERGVEVCEEWHNYQNFYKFYEKFYKEDYHLDKDILIQGNKLYSPETCCFVPININSLFTYTQAKRGGLPCGVAYNEDRGGRLGNYSAQVCQGKKNIKWLGYYANTEDAFNVYKKEKERVIRTVAEHSLWEGEIDLTVYEALLKHEVLPYPD